MSHVNSLPKFDRAESETNTRPVWVTWAIMGLNGIVFLVMVRKGADARNIDLPTLIAFGGNFGPYTLSGEVWRLLTASFVHKNFGHVAWNMLILGFVGVIVERLYGSARFAALYLFAVVTGNLTSLCSHYWLCSIGASGAVYGTFGALLAYIASFHPTMVRAERTKCLSIGAAILVYVLCAGFTHTRADVADHLGGMFAGLILGWILAVPPSGVTPKPSTLHTPAFACAVTATVIFGLGLLAVHVASSPDGQKLLAFAVVEERASVIEVRLNGEMKALGLMIKVPDRRKEFATRIYNSTGPEWNELYNMLTNAPLPDGSPLTENRNALIRYYDDMRRTVFLMADLAMDNKLGDATSARRVRELLQDAKLQRLIVMP